jgi:hypothetical protein
VLALPASSYATLRWVGPSLAGQRATLTEPAPVDDVFVLLGDPGGGVASGAMPASGQIVAAQIEGFVALTAGPPLTPVDPKFHLQDLAPAAGGRYRVKATSGFLSLPTSSHRGGSAETTVTTVHPVNLCVHRGDLVGFTTDGGYAPAYPRGLPFQVFASVPGAATGRYVAGGGVGNGALDKFTPLADTLLLMRVQLGTARNAKTVCPGGKRR